MADLKAKNVKPLLHTEKSAGRTFDLNSIAQGANGSHVTNTERACRVTVNIFDARNLRKREVGPDAKDPVFKVKLEKVTQRSREIKTVLDEHGNIRVNQSFTFDVKDVKTAVLSVHVVARGLLGLEESLGNTRDTRITDLLDDDASQKNVAAVWYDLSSKDGLMKMPGRVLMHIVAGIAEPEQKVSLFVGTWNVGNSRPPKDLSPWIPSNPDYELVAIGSQECDYPARQPFTECAKDWLHTLRVGELQKAISDVDSGSEATGVGHVMANKGGVCIGFKFWDTSLCFVNSHFAAHAGQCEARNGNYREIAGQLRVGMPTMDILNQYHHVFWFGDLNYRLDFSQIADKPLTPERTFWKEVVKKIHAGEYSDLLKYDELHKEIEASRVLHGFKEGEIKFPPTFKMQKETEDIYDQKRMPAWCDRVLWRNLPGCTIKLGSYFSAPKLITSDHKPVGATFSMTAYALPSAFVPAGNLEEDDKRWHIQFTSLRAKKLRASDINGFSDPYVSFVGPNLIHEFHSRVKHQTLNPVWNPMQELPILVLNVFPLQRLEREYVLVRVLDRDYTSSDDTLGYAVISLANAVQAFKRGPLETAHFKVPLTHRGLPAGTLEGGMKLTWERNVVRRGMSITSSLIGKTMSFKESIKKRVLLVKT
ncbi:hypothetical protein AXG93_2815s1070 [Marchantia polymorpha subsp. ruderalis]|uniref:C2 domain-containing protein n=1 Tax=Marchantia polymorpha subsp. ruderalis TaxID=1480154 RepID=A0A176WFX7_MARPO|nr:hypothetical protein AXG93_2815s1070 [Marchantia polymorpha subsp. ruderalis]